VKVGDKVKAQLVRVNVERGFIDFGAAATYASTAPSPRINDRSKRHSDRTRSLSQRDLAITRNAGSSVRRPAADVKGSGARKPSFAPRVQQALAVAPDSRRAVATHRAKSRPTEPKARSQRRR